MREKTLFLQRQSLAPWIHHIEGQETTTSDNRRIRTRLTCVEKPERVESVLSGRVQLLQQIYGGFIEHLRAAESSTQE